MSHYALMDKVYRFQRHFYDITRKFFLLGRDQLIKSIHRQGKFTLLEVGVGTGRNLKIINQKFPQAKLFGIDASEEMLHSARNKLNKHGINATLLKALAEDKNIKLKTAQKEGFDEIVFSYCLSMIPNWGLALERAIENLKPGGIIRIVDFSDSSGYPRLFQFIMRNWLAFFHVTPNPELASHIEQRAQKLNWAYNSVIIGRHYAQIITLGKPNQETSR